MHHIFGSQVKNYTIGDGVTAIGDYAFSGCSGLTSVYILDSVKTIGNYTFQNCSGLTSVTIGNSVTNLGDYAFAGCTNITKLTSCATTPPICGTQALNDINKWDCSLFVPTGSLSAYQAADQWKDFFFIEESDVTAINRIYDDEAEGRIVGIYDLNGRKFERLQRGMNIVRMSDGTTKKVVIK
ncbi:MAG: leucine-rich repeat domain-containing protein [Prevotella sp.]|nr:leucine-rich repeat domain-containing protein [Prevotella sp.]